MGEGNCNQEKQGKRSSTSASISVHRSSLQRLFLHPLLFSLSHFSSVIVDSDPCTRVSCWRRLQLQREDAVQLTSSKYHISFPWKIRYLPAEVCYMTPFCWLILEHGVLICGTPNHRSPVEGFFVACMEEARSHSSIDKCHPTVLERIHSTFLSQILLSFCNCCPRMEEGKKKK